MSGVGQGWSLAMGEFRADDCSRRLRSLAAAGDGLAIAERDGAHHTVPAHDVVVCSTHGNAAAALVVATPPEGRAGLGPQAVERLLAEV
jgi:hypothetical protein